MSAQPVNNECVCRSFKEEKIEEYANRLREQYGDGDDFINVSRVAKKLGFEVKKVIFNQKPDVSGMVINDPQSGEQVIYVDATDSLERQRFTIAHELGHVILHHMLGPQKDSIFKKVDLRSNRGNRQEQEANLFAAALLMPHKQFMKAWYLYDTMEEVSNHFGVSKKAAYLRYERLNAK